MTHRHYDTFELPQIPYELNPDRLAISFTTDRDGNIVSLSAQLEPMVADIVFKRAPAGECLDDAFPRQPFESLGYNLAVHGQKTFNGVAILSRSKFDDVTPGLPGDDSDDHAHNPQPEWRA